MNNLLIYRGGFLRYVQQRNQPGTLGLLEFRDGKGRVSDTEIELGNTLASWPARSGLLTGAAYDVGGGFGHIPPGWRLIYERTDFTGSQGDTRTGSGNNLKIKQGGYCKWLQDDASDPVNRYIMDYHYNAANQHDRAIGEPDVIRFKFQTEAIPPARAANRDQIQIHPDGRGAGTAGCIGLQSYSACQEVLYMLRSYHGLKLNVELQN